MVNLGFERNDFSYPKPHELIAYLIFLTSKKNSIILDFFAGSGTTAQAVMELNEEDGGNRKFILVTNNAEILDDKNKSTGKHIATDVTYERLHRIMKGIGTKGEKDFKWIKDRNNQPYKCNNLKVFDIEYKDISKLGNFDDISKQVKESFRLLDNNFNIDEDDFVYKLSSLHPQKMEDDNE